MILPIYLYGSQVLRTPAQEDDLSDKAWLTQFIADMIETMHHADGCGLAAPQVGVSKRILVVDGNDLVRVFCADGYLDDALVRDGRAVHVKLKFCSFLFHNRCR